MNLELLLPAIALLAGFGGLLLAALRNPREEAAAAVDLMKSLNGELEEALDRCRSERTWCRERRVALEAQLEEHQQKAKQLEANLRACVHREETLEQRLIELGEEPRSEP